MSYCYVGGVLFKQLCSPCTNPKGHLWELKKGAQLMRIICGRQRLTLDLNRLGVYSSRNRPFRRWFHAAAIRGEKAARVELIFHLRNGRFATVCMAWPVLTAKVRGLCNQDL